MRGLILSAGLGERLRPLTLQRAKPAVEFLNVPMLAFPYFWLDKLGLTEVVFNTHYLPDSIRHAAMHVVKPATQLHFTHETAILGSGGGIWNARFHLQNEDTFAVANGDGVILFADSNAIPQMLQRHQREGALATMLVCPLEGVGTRIPGVWQKPDGTVVNFGKQPAEAGLECLHYASVMLISKRIWNYLPEGSSNILYDVFTEAMAQGERVIGHRVDQMLWFETGNAAEYLRATRTCLEHLRSADAYGRGLSALLDRFTVSEDHATKAQDLAQLQLISSASQIDGSAKLSGMCVIGDDAQIGGGAQIKDCVVLPRAKVPAGSVYHNEILL